MNFPHPCSLCLDFEYKISISHLYLCQLSISPTVVEKIRIVQRDQIFRGLAPKISWPPGAPPYSIATGAGDLNAPQPRTPVMRMIPLNIPQSPMPIASTLLPPMVGPPMGHPVSITISTVPVPPPPGYQFTPLPAARPFVPTHMPLPAMLPMVPQPPSPQGIPPPPPEEAPPPPPPEESKPKRKRVDDTSLIPEDQTLLAGSVHISVSVPKVDEGNLKGQTLEISMQSLTETIGSAKEKTAGEVQLPANKQKLSARSGFLKDNISVAYYNIGPGEIPTLTLRERGGRKP